MLVRVVSATHRYQRGVLRWEGDEFDASAEEAQWGIDVGNLEATTLVEVDGQEPDVEPDAANDQAEPPADDAGDAEPDQAALEQDPEPAPAGRRRRK